jgi:hypothetical protein
MPHPLILDSPVPSIEQPACTKCAWLMGLAYIEPDQPHYDRRTFVCPRCDCQKMVVVKYD